MKFAVVISLVCSTLTKINGSQCIKIGDIHKPAQEACQQSSMGFIDRKAGDTVVLRYSRSMLKEKLFGNHILLSSYVMFSPYQVIPSTCMRGYDHPPHDRLYMLASMKV